MGIKERREKEKATRRNQILDAARKLLFSKGIEKISISRIAREAEVGVGTIYFYYKSKEDIFVALQEEGIGILTQAVLKIDDNPIAPDLKLRRIADAFYDFSQTQKDYYNIINTFLSSPRIFFKDDLKQRIDMSAGSVLRVIEKIVVDGNETGLFDEKDPEKFSILFWGTIHGLVQFKKLEHTLFADQSYMKIYDYSVEKIIQGIVVK